jgi:hypothetical protein
MSYNDDLLQQRLDEIVEDIFSSTEFINFIDSFRINDPPPPPLEDDDGDDNEYYYPETLDIDITDYFRISSLYAGIADEVFLNPLVNSTGTITYAIDPEPEPVIIESFPYDKDVNGENIECSICLIDFEDEDDVSSLPCNHLFHKACIEEWCSYKADCPNCREKI